MSIYHEVIKEVAPGHDPRHIEAFMRCEHSTLDGLSREQFVAEVRFCARCVDEMNKCIVDGAEELAQSFGL